MIRIDIDDQNVRTALDRLIGRVEDASPAMREIGELLIERTRARFRQGQAPDGTPWAPPSPVTLARKRDPRPLFGESRRLSSEIAYEAGSDFVEVGSSLVYSAVHQFGAAKGAFGRTRRGAPIPWGDIPARPFLGLADDDRRDVLEILGEHLDGAGS